VLAKTESRDSIERVLDGIVVRNRKQKFCLMFATLKFCAITVDPKLFALVQNGFF
jgi:hypothetical protein